MNGNDRISFLPALKLLGIIVVFIGVLIGIMFFLNKQRNASIVATYTKETLAYEAENNEGLYTLFTDTFNQSSSCIKPGYEAYTVQQACQESVRSAIYKNITTNLKDFSSMFFVRLHGEDIEVLSLDGSMGRNSFAYHNNDKQKDELISLLSGKINQLPWDDYFYTTSGKEVVIPFDYQGKRLGAIVRRVIEN